MGRAGRVRPLFLAKSAVTPKHPYLQPLTSIIVLRLIHSRGDGPHMPSTKARRRGPELWITRPQMRVKIDQAVASRWKTELASAASDVALVESKL
jgi:hypothetical protein